MPNRRLFDKIANVEPIRDDEGVVTGAVLGKGSKARLFVNVAAYVPAKSAAEATAIAHEQGRIEGAMSRDQLGAWIDYLAAHPYVTIGGGLALGYVLALVLRAAVKAKKKEPQDGIQRRTR